MADSPDPTYSTAHHQAKRKRTTASLMDRGEYNGMHWRVVRNDLDLLRLERVRALHLDQRLDDLLRELHPLPDRRVVLKDDVDVQVDI